MDQDTLVGVNLAGGWQLVGALVQRGLPVEAAFWVKPSDEDRWTLHLASPRVDGSGLGDSYHLVYTTLRDAPEWGLDPFSVSVTGTSDPMARAAADAVKPKVAGGPFAVANPKPYRGITRFGGTSLGGNPVDGAFIYPPWEPGLNPAW